MSKATETLTALMKDYLELRAKADAITEKMETAKKAFTAALGDTTEIHLNGLKVIYKYTTTLNSDAIKEGNSAEWFECMKEPELDIPLFRKMHPELVEKYTIDTKTRPLKIVV